MKPKRFLSISLFILLSAFSIYLAYRVYLGYFKYKWGDAIDSLDGVNVYYNGSTSTSKSRNKIAGYNIGLRYQCVEFVKRYYYKHYNHKMPETYGHAKDFFDLNLEDGSFNKARGLYQFTNPSHLKPEKGDLIVMGARNEMYGHVAIISKVGEDFVEIIQQNAGPFGNSRAVYDLEEREDLYLIHNNRINGWLRKQ